MSDICYEDDALACETRPSWSSRRRRIGVQRCRMTPSEMNKAAEDSEGINKRNKQEEYDFMNCASPPPLPRSSPEDCSEGDDESVLVDREATRNKSESSLVLLPYKKTTVREREDARPRYGVASVCGRRRDMEDTVAIHPSFVRKQTEFSRARWHYFGVYDGHGCSHVRTKRRHF